MSSDATAAAAATVPLRLETARLIMRGPEVSDAPAELALMTNPKNIEHDPEHETPTDKTLEVYEQRIAKIKADNEKGDKALFVVCLKNADGSEGPFIGLAGLPFRLHNAEGKPGNTGCMIDSAYWHQGYATEALIANLDFGFDVLGFEVIEQTTHAVNTMYRGLMKYMELEAYAEERPGEDGTTLEANYPVTRAQWQEAKAKILAKQAAKAALKK